MYVGLSLNGTLIDDALADRIRDLGFDYVGRPRSTASGRRHRSLPRRAGGPPAAALPGSTPPAPPRCEGRRSVHDDYAGQRRAELPGPARPGRARGLPEFYLSVLRLRPAPATRTTTTTPDGRRPASRWTYRSNTPGPGLERGIDLRAIRTATTMPTPLLSPAFGDT